MRLWLGFVLVVQLSGLPVKACGQDASMLDDMTTSGIVLSPRQTERLTPPPMIDATTPLDSLGGRIDWSSFGRNSVNAPVWLDMRYLLGAEAQRIGQRIEFSFVIHVAHSRLRDVDWVKGLVAPGDPKQDSPASIRAITADEAERLGLKALPSTTYRYLTLELLNRVIVSGIIASESMDERGVSVIAWRLVDTIDDEVMSSRWRGIGRDEFGKRTIGPPVHYQGAGGYLRLKSLTTIDAEFDDVTLVQGAILFHEPTDWFGGSNFLRSKFPLVMQESVRKLRQKLKP